MNVWTALNVQDRATFRRLREGLQRHALAAAISWCHPVILAGDVAGNNAATKCERLVEISKNPRVMDAGALRFVITEPTIAK
jgi:hypothetical protein